MSALLSILRHMFGLPSVAGRASFVRISRAWTAHENAMYRAHTAIMLVMLTAHLGVWQDPVHLPCHALGLFVFFLSHFGAYLYLRHSPLRMRPHVLHRICMAVFCIHVKTTRKFLTWYRQVVFAVVPPPAALQFAQQYPDRNLYSCVDQRVSAGRTHSWR